MNEQDYKKIETLASENDDFCERFFKDPAVAKSELDISLSKEEWDQVLLRLDENPDIDTPAIDKAIVGIIFGAGPGGGDRNEPDPEDDE